MQVIAWILGEYGGGPKQTDPTKPLKILNLISQFAHGTYESERTRAAILVAITKLHSSLGYTPNEKVDQIMNDYRFSKVLEVQLRALDYWVLRKQKTNTLQLLFNVPLTEKQVQTEVFDFSLSFLDPLVQI